MKSVQRIAGMVAIGLICYVAGLWVAAVPVGLLGHDGAAWFQAVFSVVAIAVSAVFWNADQTRKRRVRAVMQAVGDFRVSVQILEDVLAIRSSIERLFFDAGAAQEKGASAGVYGFHADPDIGKGVRPFISHVADCSPEMAADVLALVSRATRYQKAAEACRVFRNDEIYGGTIKVVSAHLWPSCLLAAQQLDKALSHLSRKLELSQTQPPDTARLDY